MITLSPQLLTQIFHDPDLVILDASLPATADGKTSQYADVTLPNARPFDLKNVFVDKNSPFPNTTPSPQHFEIECQKLGIHQDSKIVVFDNMGVFSSPRAWWLFHVMGHDNVSVLNGGLPAWIKAGFDTVPKQEKHLHSYPLGDFVATYRADDVISFAQVAHNAKQSNDNKRFTIVDARSKGRFHGTAPEPREELTSGHIAHSINLPYQDVLDNGHFKSVAELQCLFTNLCPPTQPQKEDYVFSCGSGMTACIIMMAFNIAGRDSKKVYDGSWSEWAQRQGLTTP